MHIRSGTGGDEACAGGGEVMVSSIKLRAILDYQQLLLHVRCTSIPAGRPLSVRWGRGHRDCRSRWDAGDGNEGGEPVRRLTGSGQNAQSSSKDSTHRLYRCTGQGMKRV